MTKPWVAPLFLVCGFAQSPAPPDVASPPSGGLAMRVLEPGSGTEHPAHSDCVIVSFTGWKRDGSLFSTSGPAAQCLSVAIPGIAQALMAMVPGEKRRVWVPADLAFTTKGKHEKHPPHIDLTFDLELIRILKAPPVPADLLNPPPTAIRTSSGVLLQILKAGTGSVHPTMTSRVTLNYSGWTADGKLFESTEMTGHPASVLLGTALPGWREALPYLVVGERVHLWIPAKLAYGTQKKAPRGNLVYDIELVAIE